MKKLKAITIIELLIIISVVSGLIMVTAPSLYGIFKKQFLIYDTHHLIQDIKDIQSKAFVENKYYKFGFNQTENKLKIWQYNDPNWDIFETITLENNVSITYLSLISDTNHIIYGKNGNAFLCIETGTPASCQIPLNSIEKIKNSNEKKEIIIEFLPINGYVSSNISVK